MRFDFIRRKTYGSAIIMAKPRIFIEEDSEAGVYHALSRAVDGNHIFADTEKGSDKRTDHLAGVFSGRAFEV